MRKFVVFSGFLGAGKTTAMMALTRYYTENYGKAAMISNDLGKQNLADNRLALLAGCNASELTGECICYQTENLVQRLQKLFDQDGCELVISDIPGFGVGALEHVYHTLNETYPGQFELGAFTVLAEPETLDRLSGGKIFQSEPGNRDLHQDVNCILHAQLLEADLIVLNKGDLLEEKQCTEMVQFLKERYPQAEIVVISALQEKGLEELARALQNRNASMRRADIGCEYTDLSMAMGKISEYYMQYYAVVCCNDFDGNKYLEEMASRIQTLIRENAAEIPHLKLLAWEPEGDYGKADVLGVKRPVEMSHRFVQPCTELAVMLNASAVCPAAELDRIITETAQRVSEEYQLDMMIFRKECFGMGGE